MACRPSRVVVPGVVLLVALGIAPIGTAQPAPADPRPLSLDDLAALDALLDGEEAETAALLDTGAVVDVAILGIVLAFAVFSFLRKDDRLKVVSLALSVAYLGFVKASLVSVVDIFGAIAREPARRGRTVRRTISSSGSRWSRRCSGGVCTAGGSAHSGALTQLMDRVVPARLRIEPPAWLDRRLVHLKYGVLAGAVLYVLAGGDTLVYRYIEPFWMFTLSGSALMWTLLALLLLATVFVRNPLLPLSLCGRGRPRAAVQPHRLPHQALERVPRRASSARRPASGGPSTARRFSSANACGATTASGSTPTRIAARTG